MSLVRIENDIAPILSAVLQGENNYVITDNNVVKLLPNPPKSRTKIYAIDAGEQSKNMQVIEAIISDMYAAGCNRKTTIYAVGGGVVGDIAGFVSGIYMRGISYVNVPSTLLSMVDSAIGGKTGIDHNSVKNLIGLFNEPKEIIISLSFLSSLSDDAWLSGTGEIIKTAFLDSQIYELVQSSFERIKKRDKDVMRAVIEKCTSLKRKITSADLKETGARKALNVGHTIGHALESLDGFSRSHGEYVLWGMKYENEINKGFIDGSFYLKMQTLISRALLERTEIKVDPSKATELCAMDKKNAGGFISLMAVENVGVVREIKYKPKQFLKELKRILP